MALEPQIVTCPRLLQKLAMGLYRRHSWSSHNHMTFRRAFATSAEILCFLLLRRLKKVCTHSNRVIKFDLFILTHRCHHVSKGYHTSDRCFMISFRSYLASKVEQE